MTTPVAYVVAAPSEPISIVVSDQLPVISMTTAGSGVIASLTKRADTGQAGFALQNATPTVISWTAPSDGVPHAVLVAAIEHVTTLQTGGAISLTGTDPAGNAFTTQLDAGGHAAGAEVFPANRFILIQAGSTVSVVQSSAQTAGAATLWAQLWGI